MKLEGHILGYDKDDKPIIQPEGCIYTRAFILCTDCGVPISSAGGPRYGSRCPQCYLKKAHSILSNPDEDGDQD